LIDPAAGPYLFDTSAQSWLERSTVPVVRLWLSAYQRRHAIQISAITVMERIRGYELLATRAPAKKAQVELARRTPLSLPNRILHVDGAVALQAGRLSALLPEPPTPAKRSHRLVESRSDRLHRWRCDILIASTALVSGIPLLHQNPQDFETIRMAIEVNPEGFSLGPLHLLSVLRIAA
jgi:predicted nucleic acid-binding protein